MRLRRLELQGFKSFVDRTILSFDDDITGIVGPNGCGKSNIVDALLWVMGEQSPKHIRGESMSDIIFAGSDSRPPSSMAEVSLILNRQGVSINPQIDSLVKGDELSITRRLFRDGTSEFLINKCKCRLKDIHDVFMDTGVGKRAYSIIEQGQIEKMVNIKPDERRIMFEEVAGITKYKVRRREAEKRLEITKNNLLRLNDLVSELEKRMRSLKIHATKAKKYKELKSELEIIDSYLIGRILYNKRAEIEKLEKEKIALEDEKIKIESLVSEKNSLLTEKELKRVDFERELREKSDNLHELELLIQKSSNEIDLLREREKSLEKISQNSIEEKARLKLLISKFETEIEEKTLELKKTTDSEIIIKENIENLHSEIKSLEKEVENLNYEKNTLVFQQKNLIEKETWLKTQVEVSNAKEEELARKQETFNADLSRIVVRIEDAKRLINNSEESSSNCDKNFETLNNNLFISESKLKELSETLSLLEKRLTDSRELFHTKNSRLNSLLEFEKSFEGRSPTVKELFTNSKNRFPNLELLSDVIIPDNEIEETLENFLGDYIDTLIVSDENEVKSISSFINENGFEKTRIIAKNESFSEIEELKIEANPILNLIKIKANYENSVKCLLNKVYICDTLDGLFRLREKYKDYVFISKDGKTAAFQDRTLISGNPLRNSSIFPRKREIEELKLECEKIKSSCLIIEDEKRNVITQIEKEEKIIESYKQELTELKLRQLDIKKEKEKYETEFKRLDEEYNGLILESENNLKEISENKKTSIKNIKELEAVKKEKDYLLKREEELLKSLEELQAKIGTKRELYNSKQIEISRLTEKIFNINEKINELKFSLEEAQKKTQSISSEESSNVEELNSIMLKIRDFEMKKENLESTRNSLSVELNSIKNAFSQIDSYINHFKEEVFSLNTKKEQLNSLILKSEISLTQARSEWQSKKALGFERYNKDIPQINETEKINLDALPNFTKKIEVTFELLLPDEKVIVLENYAEETRKALSHYTDVNISSIDEFEEVEKRHSFLMAQKTDLEKSLNILEEAIKKIDTFTKERFEETFYEVDKKFREIFPILFNGGKAELRLLKEEGSEDFGVDVMCQPPGKNLQSISLLSGGEKALTAVSLILAIFARKPSPFCLLDEADAPLDDANVNRFNTVIKKMADKTQFIVISHNKKTMEIMSSIYGVTMEKSGVSKMASIRFN